MLTSEYYYGLELLRPLVLWLVIAGVPKRLKRALKNWLPYLALLVAVFLWRYWVSKNYNYEITALSGLFASYRSSRAGMTSFTIYGMCGWP
jgi:hypothetical protein